ncbi:MAG: DedA family protein [Solirubrobacteraceae bacterium]|nr:DedA family protein [Solirubrobacteraceae bacterium]
MRILAASGAAGGWVGELVDAWGYTAVFVFLVVENLIPPIPSELILPLAGYYVDQGNLSYGLVVLAATAGSVVGALLIYWFGSHAGRPALERWGHRVHLKESDLDRADVWFARYGDWVVFFGRLVPGIRSVVSIPAGTSHMPMARFVALTTLGSAIWNSLLVGAGWALGHEWEKISSAIDSASTVIVAVAALAIVGAVVVFLRRRGVLTLNR